MVLALNTEVIHGLRLPGEGQRWSVHSQTPVPHRHRYLPDAIGFTPVIGENVEECMRHLQQVICMCLHVPAAKGPWRMCTLHVRVISSCACACQLMQCACACYQRSNFVTLAYARRVLQTWF